MRKTIILVFILTPLLAMAQWGQVRGQSNSTIQVGESSTGTGRFCVGLTFTADYYTNAAGVGAGLLFNIGRFTDVLNLTIGAEYIEYIAADPRPEETVSNLHLIDGGGQLVVPVTLKLLLFRTSEWSKVYIGCGGEFGFRMREGEVLKTFYPNHHALCEKSTAVVPMFGCRGRNLDFGVYYKHYFDKPFNHAVSTDKDLGKTDKRIGCYLNWYF